MKAGANEINFDGLIGPTHNYSGLSFGNLASIEHERQVSNPKQAALQGLAKIRRLKNLGVKQGVFPPHERPFIPLLKRLGYTGSDERLAMEAWRTHPELLIACSSAANMWTANAATICPSSDAFDNKTHLTPANLNSKFHRSFEASFTSLILKKIFYQPDYFVHHASLPDHLYFADEGAANHTRFCKSYDSPGVQLFVFGHSIFQKERLKPSRFPARQTLEASQAIARLHGLSSEQTVFAQQNPEAIDKGVFHNDVISVGNQQLFLYHEKAFVDSEATIDEIRRKMEKTSGVSLQAIQIFEEDISLDEAVKTYLFNSQLVSLADGMALIAPIECQRSLNVQKYLSTLLKDPNQPIRRVFYEDLRESMQNGGGPACLRLRVVLNQEEQKGVHSSVMLTEENDQLLTRWIHAHYRDRLSFKDLADPALLLETREALDELTRILRLGSIYSFQ